MNIAPIRTACRILFVIAALFAYVCAIIPQRPEIFGSDKDNHILAFFTLAFLARLGWPRRQALWVAFALVGFGGFIEISQATPIIHRDPEWNDVFADCIGIAGGMALGQLVLGFYRRFLARG
ncbi:VanZ family protein [Sphingomonas vulcanisoli]|uniref:VanZ family protein n=1 Tax=Sphingomonas vulcanisoli TaxID=1658060 RepID=A0ABX0TQF2_9SPHN|nr:VanZ family protein [Sphingomonas vulcanisoli]NIJ06974.1 VanZ family protein [Sphingomonas vulcanisoli]